MSGRVVKEITNGPKKISIILAEEVQERGFKRIIDAIDPQHVTQTAERVADAFSGSSMMDDSQKAQTDKIVIMYDTSLASETATDEP